MYVRLSLLSTLNNLVIIAMLLAIIDDSESTVPLLNGTGNGNIPINDTQEEIKEDQQPTENLLVEGTQDKTDSATDPKGELCDLSVLKSV